MLSNIVNGLSIGNMTSLVGIAFVPFYIKLFCGNTVKWLSMAVKQTDKLLIILDKCFML